MPSKRFLIGIGAVVVIGLLATTALYRIYANIPDPDWGEIKKKIRRDFPGIPETTTEALAQSMGGDNPPVIIDSRKRDEFDVSHIPGAVWATDVSAVENLAAPDAEIVVYCSVGYRSARLVAALREAGFTNVKNLEGSIFAWANEGRALVGPGGEPASTVHPFSTHWGKLLDESKRHPLE